MKNPRLSSKAVLLHSTNFRESSLIVSFFSLDFGLIKLVAKGAKLKNSKFSNIKVPGATFKIEFGGRSELKNLFTCETIGSIIIKESNFKIYLYLNELILKTLELEAPMKMIFNDLINLFKELETVKDPLEKELKLRRFEYGLIVELGYEFSLMDDNTGRKIERSKFYEFVPNRGFQETNKKGNNTCSGITIINFNNGIIENDQSKQFLKYIMKSSLDSISNKPLNSSKFFKLKKDAS